MNLKGQIFPFFMMIGHIYFLYSIMLKEKGGFFVTSIMRKVICFCLSIMGIFILLLSIFNYFIQQNDYIYIYIVIVYGIGLTIDKPNKKEQRIYYDFIVGIINIWLSELILLQYIDRPISIVFSLGLFTASIFLFSRIILNNGKYFTIEKKILSIEIGLVAILSFLVIGFTLKYVSYDVLGILLMFFLFLCTYLGYNICKNLEKVGRVLYYLSMGALLFFVERIILYIFFLKIHCVLQLYLLVF